MRHELHVVELYIACNSLWKCLHVCLFCPATMVSWLGPRIFTFAAQFSHITEVWLFRVCLLFLLYFCQKGLAKIKHQDFWIHNWSSDFIQSPDSLHCLCSKTYPARARKHSIFSHACFRLFAESVGTTASPPHKGRKTTRHITGKVTRHIVPPTPASPEYGTSFRSFCSFKRRQDSGKTKLHKQILKMRVWPVCKSIMPTCQFVLRASVTHSDTQTQLSQSIHPHDLSDSGDYRETSPTLKPQTSYPKQTEREKISTHDWRGSTNCKI